MGGTNEASVLEGKNESLASLEPHGKAKSTWQASESATAAEKALHAEWLKTGGSNQTSLSDPTPMLQIPQGQVVYIIGGMGQEAGQKNQLCSVEQYDNQKQRFVEYGSMTARRLAAAACYLSGHGLMVCGGFDGTHHLASVELLNTTTRQWEQQAPMPKARTFAGLVNIPKSHLLVLIVLPGSARPRASCMSWVGSPIKELRTMWSASTRVRAMG